MAHAPRTLRPATTLHTLDLDRLATPTPTDPVRVALCHPAPLAGEVVAAALRPAPGIARVSVVGSATELVRDAAATADVALASETLGNDLPELIEALAFRRIDLPVVVVTTDVSADATAQYLEWGAAGSVDIRRPVAAIEHAIHVASTGAAVIEDDVRDDVLRCLAERAAERERARAVLRDLSPRQRQVIESLARGVGVAEIARASHLSPHTIRACIRTVGATLGVTGQMQIAAVARNLLRAAERPYASRFVRQLQATAMSLSG